MRADALRAGAFFDVRLFVARDLLADVRLRAVARLFAGVRLVVDTLLFADVRLLGDARLVAVRLVAVRLFAVRFAAGRFFAFLVEFVELLRGVPFDRVVRFFSGFLRGAAFARVVCFFAVVLRGPVFLAVALLALVLFDRFFVPPAFARVARFFAGLERRLLVDYQTELEESVVEASRPVGVLPASITTSAALEIEEEIAMLDALEAEEDEAYYDPERVKRDLEINERVNRSLAQAEDAAERRRCRHRLT